MLSSAAVRTRVRLDTRGTRGKDASGAAARRLDPVLACWNETGSETVREISEVASAATPVSRTAWKETLERKEWFRTVGWPTEVEAEHGQLETRFPCSPFYSVGSRDPLKRFQMQNRSITQTLWQLFWTRRRLQQGKAAFQRGWRGQVQRSGQDHQMVRSIYSMDSNDKSDAAEALPGPEFDTDSDSSFMLRSHASNHWGFLT
mmetsp:Transcript_7183/g.25460  ORF Transcript_7183/g.25460 Transcript_7183/m.25460 type:complete len:203 (-) Transcript_7183:48-656(-)